MQIRSDHSPQGLGLHLLEMGGTPTVTVMLSFAAGARLERKCENGITHFLEHLVFKGGDKFPTPQAVNHAAESLGAELNAYTSHDLVSFYLTGRGSSVMELSELLVDIVAHCRLRPQEIERERGVVLQEIAMHRDDPSNVAEQLLDRAAFGSHPLGRPVLGPSKHIKKFSRRQIQDFRQRYWGAERGGLYLAGDLSALDEARLRDLAEQIPTAGGPIKIKPVGAAQRRVLVEDCDSALSHLGLQWRLPEGFDHHDPQQRAVLAVYTTLLGGASTSRLFSELREKRGLCYQIEAYPELHQDCADIRVYTEIEHKSCLKSYRQIAKIVKQLGSKARPTAEEVARCRAVAAGELVRELEGSFAVANQAAEQTLVYGHQANPLAELEALDAVSVDDVCQLAECFAEPPSISCVGPHHDSDFA